MASLHASTIVLICVIFQYCLWVSETVMSNPAMAKVGSTVTKRVFPMTGLVSTQHQTFLRLFSQVNHSFLIHKCNMVWEYLGLGCVSQPLPNVQGENVGYTNYYKHVKPIKHKHNYSLTSYLKHLYASVASPIKWRQ